MKSSRLFVAAFSLLAVLTLTLCFLPKASQAGGDNAYVEKGHKLFRQYCASCHGLDGKGNGPVAASLKSPPADLTALQKKGEKFPTDRVMTIIDGEQTDRIEAHGTNKMPVWGTEFRRTVGLQKNNYVLSLTRYLESIQAARK
jgi:mono/diheme cytochrome c family protein